MKETGLMLIINTIFVDSGGIFSNAFQLALHVAAGDGVLEVLRDKPNNWANRTFDLMGILYIYEVRD